jgi:hypothetical protein
VRIISDPFPVHSGGTGGKPGGAGAQPRGKPGDKPGGGAVFGRYGCCEKGLVLIRGTRLRGGGREPMARYESGALAECVFQGAENRDPKSGALVVDAKLDPANEQPLYLSHEHRGHDKN